MLDLAGAVQSADECRARKLPFTVEPQVQQSQTKSLAPELLQACTAAGLRRKGDHMVQKKLVATVVTSQRLLRASESDCRPSASEVTTTLQDHPQPRLLVHSTELQLLEGIQVPKPREGGHGIAAQVQKAQTREPHEIRRPERRPERSRAKRSIDSGHYTLPMPEMADAVAGEDQLLQGPKNQAW